MGVVQVERWRRECEWLFLLSCDRLPGPRCRRRSLTAALDCAALSLLQPLQSDSQPAALSPAHIRLFPCRSAPAMADDSPFGDFTNDQQQSSPYVEDGDEPVIALPPPSVPTTDRQPVQPPHVHRRLQCSDCLQCACEPWMHARCWCGAAQSLSPASLLRDGSLTVGALGRCLCLIAVRLGVAIAVAMTTPSRVAMHRCTTVRLRMHSV